MKAAAILVIAISRVPQAALAVIAFDQPDDGVFVVSHRIEGCGSGAGETG
ncbi:MAG: hypothetical protein OEP45_15265 [Acidobacteriota bacterium]|nr:hypothetical protein [Acidobacteriota bacterium]